MFSLFPGNNIQLPIIDKMRRLNVSIMKRNIICHGNKIHIQTQLNAVYLLVDTVHILK